MGLNQDSVPPGRVLSTTSWESCLLHGAGLVQGRHRPPHEAGKGLQWIEVLTSTVRSSHSPPTLSLNKTSVPFTCCPSLLLHIVPVILKTVCGSSAQKVAARYDMKASMSRLTK